MSDRVAIHYYSATTLRRACGTKNTRSVNLVETSDRAKFDEARKSGHACERCCASLDKKDAISAKYAGRAQRRPAAKPSAQPRVACEVCGHTFEARWLVPGEAPRCGAHMVPAA